MGAAKLALSTLLLVVFTSLANAATFSKQITGLDLAQFEGRDVLVVRTTGDVAPPSAFRRDKTSTALLFSFPQVGADTVSAILTCDSALIRSVDVVVESQHGTQLIIDLASAELASQQCFRFTQPSTHVLLLEIFPEPGHKNTARHITDLEALIHSNSTSAESHSQPDTPPAPGLSADPLDAIPMVDLRKADPQRVLGLAASIGLLDVKGDALVATEHWGELAVTPAGQSLVNWAQDTPPGELLLSGSPQQVALFLAQADPQLIASQPTLARYWVTEQPRTRAQSLAGGASAATRTKLRDDPYNGLFFAETLPGGGRLSDIRVTLNATGGLNLYDVLDYLSQVSGISIILDPYMFDEPTGNTRPPLEPEDRGQTENPGGFRTASAFNPTLQRPGSVRGNFVNMPFDDVLRTILEIHELEFVVINEGQPNGQRYGRGSNGSNSSYAKPVILVTSRERLEQELPGSNEIDLYQLHYADPVQVTEILQQLNLLSPSGSGWYVYNGGNVGSGGTGGRPSGGGNSPASAPADVVVYQGSSREPVYEEARRELELGRAVVRVRLDANESDYLITVLGR